MSVGRCHSAFVHYEMFHGHGACHGGGNNYGSIFNINYNCSGRHGNFWTGLASGLGYGIGSWLMGGLNMVGNWFGLGGGMGFGGGWGFGMPMFNWGGGSAGRAGSDYGRDRDYSRERSTERDVEKEVVKTDSEYDAINDAREQLQKLQAKKDPVTDAEIQALKDQIAALTAKDGINDTENDDQIAMLKADFEKFKAGITSDSSEDDTVVTETGDADDTGVVDIAGIDLDKVKELKDPQIDKLTKDQAIDILKKIGYITGEGDEQVGKLSNIYPVLKLLEKSGVTVEVEYREASTDKWVKGPISNVTKDAEGKLSYNVDANAGTLKGKYTFTSQNKENSKYKADKAADNTAAITVDNTIELEWQDEKKPLQNNSGRPLVKAA